MVLYLNADGRVDKVYCLAQGERSIANDLGGLKSMDRLRQQIEKRGFRVAKSYAEYHSWFAKITGVRPKAMEIFNQTVAVKDIQSLNRFIREHMLEAKPWNEKVENLLIQNHQSQLAVKQESNRRYHDALRESGIVDKVLDLAAFTAVQTKAPAVLHEIMQQTAKHQKERDKHVLERGRINAALREDEFELKALMQRQGNLPEWMASLRRALCADLRLPEKELPFAAEIISVNPDERDWEASIEMVLRGFALSLLVPQRYYHVVSRHVDGNKLLDGSGRERAIGRIQEFKEFGEIDFAVHEREIAELLREKQVLEEGSDAIRLLKQRLAKVEMAEKGLQAARDKVIGEETETVRQLKAYETLIANAKKILKERDGQGTLATHAESFPDIEAYFADRPLAAESLTEQEKEFKDSRRDEIDRLRKDIEPTITKLTSAMNRFLRDFPNERAEIESKIELLNKSLRQLEYRPGTFMQLEPKLVRDAEITEFQTSLAECLAGTFEGTLDADEARYLRIEKLISRLREEQRWREKVIDVRRWFDFIAREIESENGRERGYYEDSAGQSGGEKAKLAFTILVAAIAYQYDIALDRQTSNRFHFVVVDEMFSKVDDRHAEYALKLFKQFGLQLLIVAPLDAKACVTQPYVGSYLHVVKDAKTNQSEIFSMTAREFEDEVVESAANHKAGGKPRQSIRPR